MHLRVANMIVEENAINLRKVTIHIAALSYFDVIIIVESCRNMFFDQVSTVLRLK